MMRNMNFKSLFVLCGVALCFANSTKAQDAAPGMNIGGVFDLLQSDTSSEAQPENLFSKVRFKKDKDQDSGVLPEEIEPIFFTNWEYSALQDALIESKKPKNYTNTPTEVELMRDKDKSIVNVNPPTDDENLPPPPPEKRYINLHGIAFKDTNDWTVWLNGERVTPNALPKEIISMSVHEDYIEMKWYDDYTRQIFPLRIRANQRFNMDTRIFLPG